MRRRQHDRLDYLRDRTFSLLGGRLLLDCYQVLFLFGWITRTLGVVILLWVIGPGREAARGDAT